MSGRPYGIKERKLIVDYLVEHKAFGQTKAKTFWVDFANSQLTSRTWQSLKETFLKRILPDIHNPYYELTTEQIESFKRGFDIKQTEKRKLEVRKERVEGSSANGKTKEDNGESSIHIKTEGEKTTGEDVISKTLSECNSNRSSTDTVVLEEVYQTAEDIQKVLESPTMENDEDQPQNKSTTKTLRDLITYTEPLTPMLQEVLDDFASESEEDGMHIVEDNPENNEIVKIPDDTHVAVEKSKEIVKEVLVNDINDPTGEINVNKPFRGTDIQKVLETNIDQNDCTVQKESSVIEKVVSSSDCQEIINLRTENHSGDIIDTTEVVNTDKSSTEKQIENSTENCSCNTTDTVLPNNQEALDANKSISNTMKSNKTTTGNDTTEQTTDNTQNRTSSASIDNSETRNEESGQLNVTTGKVKEKQDNDNKVKEKRDSDNIEKEKQDKNINDAFDKLKGNSDHKQNDNHEDSITKESLNKTIVENPCLQSVSLYTEDLNNDHDSDSSIAEITTTNKDTNKNVSDMVIKSVHNEVVVLNSHSESSNTPPKCNSTKPTTKVQRHKAFANLFGFTGGAVSSTRKGKLSLRRRRTSRHNMHDQDKSSSTEWMSEDDSDFYVDPPRARKHRVTRKLLKPPSARILSLEEDGGLFVMYGKNIYPLVKDGKIMNNYLTYMQDSDSETEGENYWKQKYAEEKQKYDDEKKKAEKLKELLSKAKEPTPIVISPQPPDLPRTNKARESTSIVISPQASNLPRPSSKAREQSRSGSPIVISPEAPKLPRASSKARDPAPIVISPQPTNLPRSTNKAREPSPIVISEQPALLRPMNKPKEPSPRVISPQPPNLPRASVPRETKRRIMSTSSSCSNKEMPSPQEPTKRGSMEILKIKFAKNNEEVQVEGHWPQINAVLEQVVETFHKYTDGRLNSEKRKSVTNISNEKINMLSRATTPGDSVDPEIHKKVNELENKIFEEIEQKDQEEIVKDDPEKNNITLRRGKGRKISTSSVGSLSKKARVSSEPEENADKNLDETRANTSKRITRTPKKASTEPETSESPIKPMQTRNSKTRNISLTLNNEEPQYMISLKNRKRNTITNFDRNKREKQNGRSFADVTSSLDNTLLKSDSMQGYQDSDASPVVNHKRKKRSLRYSTHNLKKQHRNKKFKRNVEYITSDSSNCSYSGQIKNAIENSSVYKSDSYKILMTKNHPFSVMEIIDEDNATSKSLADIKYFNAISSDRLNIRDRNTMSNPASGVDMHANSDSSSMASLPMSPVLSVIENISMRKDSFNALDQAHSESKVNDKSEYVSDKDLPPMCEISDLIAKKISVNKDTETRMSIDNRRSTISDSFLDKVKRVEIRERSVSDTIDKGIKDLLLDSARKKPKNTETHMELDVPESDSKKSKVKKRCSTPRKKKNLNAKFNQIAEVIQEHVETYSSGGRKSCPPSVRVYDCDDNIISNDNTLSVPDSNKRSKKKKDIIKVKILKPKRKSKSKQMSLIETDLLYKDSGINNTELELLQTMDDSVEFIHNHSDTCIHGNECMGDDSVEFVGSSESIITLSNASTQSCHAWFGKQTENVPQDVLHNTNNASTFIDDSGVLGNTNATSKNLFDSPISAEASYNSLITDDLSDEIVTPPNSVTKPLNWYLFSEDDSTNFINQDMNNGSVGSNLNKLFPIACAVPNLSTITELSRENGECSRKASDEKDTDGS